jgi:hypothetical protein
VEVLGIDPGASGPCSLAFLGVIGSTEPTVSPLLGVVVVAVHLGCCCCFTIW